MVAPGHQTNAVRMPRALADGPAVLRAGIRPPAKQRTLDRILEGALSDTVTATHDSALDYRSACRDRPARSPYLRTSIFPVTAVDISASQYSLETIKSRLR